MYNPRFAWQLKQYASKIRNLKKRSYALDYGEFLMMGGEKPNSCFLSRIAKQAVEMTINSIANYAN